MLNAIRFWAVVATVFAAVFASHVYRAVGARERAVRATTGAPVVLTPAQEEAAQRIADQSYAALK